MFWKARLTKLDIMMGNEVSLETKELAAELAEELNQQYRKYLNKPSSSEEIKYIREMQDIFEE